MRFTQGWNRITRFARKSLLRPALLAGILTLCAAGSAFAQGGDTVLTFDDLTPGALTGQYQSKGIVFDNGLVPGQGNFTGTIESKAGAKSPPNVVTTFASNELSSPVFRGRFTNRHHSFVTVSVLNNVDPVGASDVTLTAWDPGGNRIQSVDYKRFRSAGFTPIYTPVTVTSNLRNIAYFTVAGVAQTAPISIDNVRFDDIGTVEGPDFFFYPYYGRLTLQRGGPGQTVRLHLGRIAGSTGNIALRAENLPFGITATFTPNPVSGNEVDMTLQASPGAITTNGKDANFKVIGTPTASAGTYGLRELGLAFNTVDSIDLKIVGMEVTQAVQPYDLPQRDPANPNAPVSYLQPGREGVRLSKWSKTKVRVFTALDKTWMGKLPAYSVKLYGFRPNPITGVNDPLFVTQEYSDVEQKFVYTYDLNAEKAIGVPVPGPDSVTDDQRSGKNGGEWLFELPNKWLEKTLILEARLEFPVSFFTPPAFDSNADNNRFTLTDIRFSPTYNIRIKPVALRVTAPDAVAVGDEDDVFAMAQRVTPGGLSIGSWGGEIDITDIWSATEKDCGFLGLASCDADSGDRGDAAVARLRLFSLASGILNKYDYSQNPIEAMLVGVFPSSDAGTKIRARSVRDEDCSGGYWSCEGQPVAIVRSQDRPLSSVAHEVGHMLGRNHASGACTASAEDSPFDSWPPDEQGRLSSVGYDVIAETVLFPPRDGTAPMFYDIMSYCGNNSGNDPDKWISVRGWNLEFDQLFWEGQAQKVAGARPLQANGPTLAVQAYTQSDGFILISGVTPGQENGPTLEKPASPYRLRVKNAAGETIQEVGMIEEESDNEPPTHFLSAQVPATDAESVEIVKDGNVLAQKVRSAAPPVVEVPSVQPDVVRAGVRVARLEWKATDADGDKLMTMVDFSPDGGQSWRILYYGPNTDTVELKNAMIAGTENGLFRVRVNDGFNETAAVSEAFTTVGAPPTVKILSPSPDQKFMAGGTVQLIGEANDSVEKPIPGEKMNWYDGDRLLGTGSDFSVNGLRPGAHTLRLVATDERNRQKAQTIKIEIQN